jgi:hypothetical protein
MFIRRKFRSISPRGALVSFMIAFLIVGLFQIIDSGKLNAAISIPSSSSTTSIRNDGALSSITVTNPSNPVEWPVYSVQTITWTSVNVTGTVDIILEYYQPGGNPRTIIEHTANDGIENWLVDAYPMGGPLPDYYVKVVANSLPGVFGQSGSIDVTGVSGPQFVIAPDGGDNFAVGTTQTITWWTDGITGNVNIHFSRDGGANWTSIAENIANTGHYDWTVSGPSTTNALIRISSISDPSMFDKSDSSFNILATTGTFLAVTSPSGGESWAIGSSHNITWSISPSVTGNINLFVSRDGGGTWTLIVADTANDGSFPWLIDGFATNKARIKVVSTNDHNIFDTSDTFFAISGGNLTVTSPNGWETWCRGTNQTITWATADLISNVKIEISLDNGVNWVTITSNTINDGSYEWRVSSAATSQALIRITTLSEPINSDVSNTVFTISGDSIRVTSPNGGEKLYIGKGYRITWTSAPIGNIDISVSRDNGTTWSLINSNAVGNECFWDPISGLATTQALIKISTTSDPSIYDISDAVFSIVGEYIFVITPNGGESWTIGKWGFVTWDALGINGNINIEITRDDGVTWSPLVQNTPNDGNESWRVNNPPTTQARFRISSVSNTAILDVSDAVFTILQATISSPSLLRIQTSPAVPTRIYLDGIQRNDWGLNWIKMPVGAYMLSFSDVYGYTTPASVSVKYYPGGDAVTQSLNSPINIYSNTVTEVIVNFSLMGNLRVQTSPPMPATIYCNGNLMDDWAFWANIAPGDYNISFEPMNGYITPDPVVATVIAGETTNITGMYTTGSNTVTPVAHGLLRVQTSPAVPTSIYLDGIHRNDWGLNWVKMPAGSYILSFSDVYGYTTPTSVSVKYYPGGDAVTQSLSSPIMIYNDTVTEVIVNFIQLGNLRVETLPATPATIYCNGNPMNDWAFWVNIEPGSYIISFQAVAGLLTPPPMTVTVVAGAATHVVGNYNTGQNMIVP